MNTRFKIVPSSSIPYAGKTYCELGYPDPAYMYNNICIVEAGNYGAVVPVNNNVLHEALLADRELTLQLLGIRVFDKDEKLEATKIVEKIVYKNPPKEPKPKVKQPLQKESSSDTIIIDGELSKKYGLPIGKEVDKALLATVKPKEV